jgi:hypothetical protein
MNTFTQVYRTKSVAANETVGKRILGSTFPNQPLVERPDSRAEGGLTHVSLRHRSVECTKRVDLAEIVYQSEPRTRPLYIHIQPGPCMRFWTQMLAMTCSTTPALRAAQVSPGVWHRPASPEDFTGFSPEWQVTIVMEAL